MEFMASIRSKIHDELGVTASAGISHNMLLSRLSTRKAKPNGQYLLEQSDVEEFIKLQDANDLPGVGWSMSSRLKDIKITTCQDMQKLSLKELQVWILFYLYLIIHRQRANLDPRTGPCCINTAGGMMSAS